MKTCYKCNALLPLENFYRDKHRVDGREYICITCSKKKPSKQTKNAYNRAYALKQKYNLTIEQYQAMLKRQNGVCALCGEAPTEKWLAVDHDHRCCPGIKSCGKCVRGLLCTPCNTALHTVELVGLTPISEYLGLS